MSLVDKIRRTNEKYDEIDQKLAQFSNIIETLSDDLQNLASEIYDLDSTINSHDCRTCHDHDEIEYVYVASRDHPKVHKAIETDYPWMQKHLESIIGHPTPCQTANCDGTLWTEYLEDERYLIKCTNKCRIIWVHATSPAEAIHNAHTNEPYEK